MNKFFIFLFVLFFSLSSVSSENIQFATLEVEIIGLENSDGIMRSHIYIDHEAFPTKSKKAKYKKTSMISKKSCTLIYEDIPFGDYAMTTHHDENNNGKMDKNWLGLPAEAWGISNNPTVIISLPPFDECSFKVDKQKVKIKIEMNY